MTGVVAMAIVVLLVCFLFLSMVSCTNDNQSFLVVGTVDGGADSTLIVEALTLDGIQECSSCKVGKDGTFGLVVERPDSILSPDFYRLRLGSQVINFVVDSIECITVSTTSDAFGTAYDIEGKVAVTARPDPKRGEQLIVFYEDGCGLDPVDAGTKLRESGLPNLWVPRPDSFFPLEKIPFLGNGKKDLKKLRELAANAGR
jgi:hypothetical protein